jgi:AGZA family xanthine/uracil permease-like MFS transporter
MRQRLERYFEFEKLKTNWKTEILAGFTTFLTMAYIIFVNPSLLQDAGMPFGAVMAATCVSAAFGSILMGVVARYPIAMAPGMGLNAYFAYSVVGGAGVSWQVALGAVFLSGVAFSPLRASGRRWGWSKSQRDNGHGLSTRSRRRLASRGARHRPRLSFRESLR